MRVLVADDEPLQRRFLSRLLESWGYEPVCREDGLTSLDSLCGVDPPPVAILDWIMPGMDGVDVCRRLRQTGCERYVYVLLITGHRDRSFLLEGLDAGADDFLFKPVDPAELRVRLRTGQRIADLQDQLTHLAASDPLTGVANRRAMDAFLRAEWARATRARNPMALLMLDVDHFKNVNDRFGHEVGDEVLQETARRVEGALRPYDRVARYGGEEFLAVLPACSLEDAMAAAERVRRRLAEQPVRTRTGPLDISASIGVIAASPDEVDGPQDLVRLADAALYRAKERGRNRVEAAIDPTVRHAR